MDGMEPVKKCFTVTWCIENYNFCYQTVDGVTSPFFFIDSSKDTSWGMQIYPKSSANKDHIALYVHRISGPPNNDYNLECEISVFADDSSSLYKEHYHKDFIKDYSTGCYVPHHKVYTKKRGEFLLPKTLTVRCGMYKSKESSSGQCFARTRIRVEKTAFIGLAEKFSTIVPDEKRILFLNSASTKKQLLALNLSLAGDLCCKERVWMEVIPVRKDYIKLCRCKLFLLDFEGTKTECGRSEILFNDSEPQEWKFPLNFTKGFLMKKNAPFLSNDTLTLKCEFAFSTGMECEDIEDSEFDDLAAIDQIQPLKFSSALEDMTCLYNDGILCDIMLRTETETFNVHKNVLSARSSVFKTMFTIDMRGNATDCVIIEDLEADTVRQMIMFLYSDKLEDLNWERAKSLYLAAVMYNIVALKYRCSDFLINNLQPHDSCDLLLLSDRYQDEELKKEVQEYIAEHHEEILLSDQWENLGKRNPMLTTETFQTLFLRNWKK